MSQAVLSHRTGDVLEITLNRPERLNAMNEALINGLYEALEQARESTVRAVVITGTGRAFCVGGDVKMFGEIVSEGQGISKDAPDLLHRTLMSLRTLPMPVIAAVNGVCAGAGFSLMLACDLAFAAESAKFTLAYLGIGTSPDGGSTWFLPRHVGLKKTMELFLAMQPMPAQQVLELGLVNRTIPADRVVSEARQMATMLAMGPTAAIGRLKQLLNASTSNSLQEQFEMESEKFAESTLTEDFRHGVASFLQKKMPTFTGS